MKFRVTPNAGGGWLCDVRGRLPSGVQYRRRIVAKVSTERQAQDFAAKHWQAVLDGVASEAQKRTPLFRDFAERWMREYCAANRLKPSGQEHKQIMLDAHLLPLFGKLKLSQIGPTQVAEVKLKLAHRAPKTVNNVLVVLSKMLSCAVEWGELESAPTIKLLRVERKSRPFLTHVDYAKLIAGAAKVSAKALALVLLAGDAGLRRGEIFALEWADIDASKRFVVVQRSRVGKHTTSTKGNSARYVPLTKSLMLALDALPRKGPLVLPKMTAKSARELVQAAERKAEMPETGKLHILRHTFASHLAMAGESIYHLQAALGHQDHSTTQGYAHLAPDSLLRLAGAIDRGRQDTYIANEAMKKLNGGGTIVVGELGLEPDIDDPQQAAEKAKKSP